MGILAVCGHTLGNYMKALKVGEKQSTPRSGDSTGSLASRASYFKRRDRPKPGKPRGQGSYIRTVVGPIIWSPFRILCPAIITIALSSIVWTVAHLVLEREVSMGRMCLRSWHWVFVFATHVQGKRALLAKNWSQYPMFAALSKRNASC